MSLRDKSAQCIYFLGATVCLVMAFAVAHTGLVFSDDMDGYWIITYVIFLLIIFLKLRQGILDEPIVLVGSSYFLLLIFGTLVFELFKDRPLNVIVSNLIGLGFSALMGGILIGDIIGPHAPGKTTKHTASNAGLVYVLAILGILASLVMFVKFRGLPMLAADPNEAKVNFLSGNGIFNLFFKGMSVFALAVLYERYHNGKSLVVAHLYYVTTMILTLAAGYRSSTIVSLGEYLSLYLILTKIKIPLTRIALIGFLLIMFLTTWGAFRRGNNSTVGLMSELDMVINGRPVIIEAILKNFDTDDFFNGSLYYSDFKRFLPGVQVNANVDLKYAIFPRADLMPDNAGITPSIVGEAYMNFGQVGVFWVLLITGIFLGFLNRLFIVRPTFLRASVFLTLVFGIADAVQTGIGLKLVHLSQFWVWAILLGIIFEIEFVPNKKMVKYSL